MREGVATSVPLRMMTPRRRRRAGKVLRPAAPLIALAACLVTGISAPAAAPAAEPLRVGNHLPPLSLTDIKGGEHRFDWEAGSGEAALFYFFTFRSAEGVYGLNAIDRINQQAAGLGLRAFAVDAGEGDRVDLLRSLGRYQSMYPPLTFPVAPDAGGRLRKMFGVGRLPALVLAERHGVVLMREEGFTGTTAPRIVRSLEEALRVPAGAVGAAAPPASDAAGDRRNNTPDHPHIFLGDRVPAFSVRDFAGREHAFDWASPDPGVTVIFFWGDPCAPCLQAMLFFDRILQRAERIGAPLRLLGVAVEDLDAAGAAAALERYRRVYPAPAYPLALDSVHHLSRFFGLGTLPTVFFIDERGVVFDWVEGFDSLQEGVWLDKLEKALRLGEGALGGAGF